MGDLPLIVLILLGLLAWLLLAVGLVLLVVVLPRWRRSDQAAPPRGVERRTRSNDRRVGLPDTREVRIERRSGIDRRRGPAAMA